MSAGQYLPLFRGLSISKDTWLILSSSSSPASGRKEEGQGNSFRCTRRNPSCSTLDLSEPSSGSMEKIHWAQRDDPTASARDTGPQGPCNTDLPIATARVDPHGNLALYAKSFAKQASDSCTPSCPAQTVDARSSLIWLGDMLSGRARS